MVILTGKFKNDMNIMRRWKTRRCTLAWKFDVDGQVWRLLPSGSGPLIVEDRDIEGKKVQFTSLDESTGAVQWTNSQYRDRWWVSIETLHEDVLFLHEYATPDMPDHRKIIALDLADGTLLWSNDDMKFLFAHRNSLYAAKDTYDHRQFYEVDLRKGTVLREVDDAYLGVLRTTLTSGDDPSLQFPRTVRRGDADGIGSDGKIRAILESRPGIDVIEVIDHPSGWILGCYERESPDDHGSALRHLLSIFDNTTEKSLYEDELDVDMKVSVPDLFFCRREMLYYISRKKTICAVHLSKT